MKTKSLTFPRAPPVHIQNLTLNAALGKGDHSLLKFDFIVETEKGPQKIQTIYHKGDYKSIAQELNIDWMEQFELKITQKTTNINGNFSLINAILF